jgi:FKBP-type peptidyl-prolyl cis-trans isomerase 2
MDMVEKKRKMVSVNFTGKELVGNTVFDTTLAQLARDAGIFDEKRKYSPLDIIVGEKELLDRVEKEIDSMIEGEKRTIKLLAKEGFGERRSELIRVVPLQNFLEQKINPFPGLVVRVSNAMGRVQSVSSGRVRIDFNHPLAGRDLEYNVEVVKEIKDKKEVAEKIFEKYYSRIPGTKKDYSEGKLTITASGDFLKNLEKVNDAIKGIAKDFGIELNFVEDKVEKVSGEKVETEVAEVKETTHVHGPNCNHDHGHDHEHHFVHEVEPTHSKLKELDTEVTGKVVSTKEKSINKIAKEIVSEKKPAPQFDVKRDSASTIQRPKKK